MPLEPDLLAILVCPENHRPLRSMEPTLLATVNERIAAGTLRNRKGERVSRPLTEALVRDGGDLFYPVDDGIPVLLVEEGVPLD
jgi:uncharacterized protein